MNKKLVKRYAVWAISDSGLLQDPEPLRDKYNYTAFEFDRDYETYESAESAIFEYHQTGNSDEVPFYFDPEVLTITPIYVSRYEDD